MFNFFKNKKFFQAVSSNDIDTVREMIEHGININCLESKRPKRSALMIACRNGNKDLVSLLLKNNVDINYKDFYGKHALYYSLNNNSKIRHEITQLLFDYNIEINLSDNEGRTVIFNSNIRLDDLKLLFQNGSDINHKDHAGKGILKFLMDKSDSSAITIIDYLINQNINLNNYTKDELDELYLLMVTTPYENSIRILKKNGATINPDEAGELIYRSISRKVTDEVLKKITSLINFGANVNYMDGSPKNTSLIKACEYNNLELVKLLLKANANVNIGEKQKLLDAELDKRPIFFALKNENYEMVKLLIDKGAELPPLHFLGSYETLPNSYYHCKEKSDNYYKIIQLLIDSGADVNQTLSVPINLAGRFWNGYAQQPYQKIPPSLFGLQLIEKYTPLMVAARNGWHKYAKLLIENGADVNAKAKNDWTALMFSVIDGHSKLVKLLIDNGADVMIEGQCGTALKLSNYCGYFECEPVNPADLIKEVVDRIKKEQKENKQELKRQKKEGKKIEL